MSGMTAATRKSTASTPLLHIYPVLPPLVEARARRERSAMPALLVTRFRPPAYTRCVEPRAGRDPYRA